MATVSSLGSQIFGTSQITRSLSLPVKVAHKPSFLDRFMISSQTKKEAECTPSDILSAEHIAELEHKARETYIKAAKEHQALKAAGVLEGSPQWTKSEKKLRDCYAQIEYWESLSNEEVSRASQHGSKPDTKVFGDRDPMQLNGIDFDGEEQKAREAYIKSMVDHQGLVNQGISTHSDQWISSLAKVHECLASLQYWESRHGYAVPPTL